MATSLKAKVPYKIRRALKLTDPDISWEGTEPTIFVQPAEIKRVALSLDDQARCQQVANQSRIPLENVIKDLKLQKAGTLKYKELKAAGRFKWPGAKRSSLSSADTQLIPTTTATTAPTTSRSVTSILGGIATAAGRYLPGNSDPKPAAAKAAESEDVEVSIIESFTDSVGGQETEESDAEEAEDKEEKDKQSKKPTPSERELVLEDDPTGDKQEEPAEREIEISEYELTKFEEFKKYRWQRFVIPPPSTTSPSKLAVIEYFFSLEEALKERNVLEYYEKDIQAIEQIANGRYPWSQLGSGSPKELVAQLLNNQFTSNIRGLPRRVYILYSEYYEVIRHNLEEDPHDEEYYHGTLQRLAFAAKLQLAHKFGLLTDPEERFYTRDSTASLKRYVYLVHATRSESDASSDKSENEPIMATIPFAIKSALDMAKDDIEQAESSIGNHANLPLDADDISNLRDIIREAEFKIDEQAQAIYAITNITDDIMKDIAAIHKLYHGKVKNMKIQLSKIERKLGISSNNQQGQPTPRRPALPKLELTKFGGEWSEWLSFQDIFNVTIMNRPEAEIDAVTKFQYLRQSLYGAALQSVSGIPVTSTNLNHAWKILTDKYNDPRKLLDHYVADMDRISIESPTAQKLHDTYVRINNNRHHLKKLGVEVESNDPLLVSKFSSHFDYETKTYFEMYLSIKGETKPTWETIGEVIKSRCRVLESMPKQGRTTRQQQHAVGRATVMTAQRSFPQRNPPPRNYNSPPPCIMCSSYHWLRQCDRFRRLTVEGRSQFVRERQLCANCFSPSHNGSSCPSRSCCMECNGRHHTMLHFHRGGPPQAWTPSNRPSVANPRNAVVHNRPSVAHHRPPMPQNRPSLNHNRNAVVQSPPNGANVQANMSNNYSGVILPTVRLLVKNSSQEMVPLRALLDTGSQSTFITERAVQLLRLTRRRTNVHLTGIGQSAAGCSKGVVNLIIRSNVEDNEEITTSALILEKVTSDTPSSRLAAESWTHLKGLQLADPQYNLPGKIDLVLGSDIVFQCFRGARIIGQQNQPIAHATSFGWVIGGPSQALRSASHIQSNLVTSANLSITTLQQFWGVEGLCEEVKEYQKDENLRCEEIFCNTTRRCKDGKLEVEFPFKTDPPDVGSSKEIAVKRLAGTEARLARNPELRKQYEDFMNDYEAQGHMVEVKTESKLNVYLPHHPIIRTSVLTTKVRVVFDASAKTSNGRSLNDSQLVGPVIQDDLFSLLTRFRLHKVAITGDIQQMYRQIWISPHHQDYQRILWRRKPADPIAMFQLRTVTYGTASAPWLATRALQYIAEQEKERHPEASRIIREDFYMDDLMGGGDDAESAHRIQDELSTILLSYGLPLRKWSSNDDYVIRAIKGEQEMLVNPDEVVKTLGLKWSRTEDVFKFNVQLKTLSKLTKREMISEIATTFDPLGFAAPVMVLAKILYQEVWQTPTDWDDELPANIGKKYQALREQLASLEAMHIPRWLGTVKTDGIELHVFTDASEKAYGACVYLRKTGTQGTFSNLVASKTRVAPLKTVSLPRLELMGAVLGAQLMEQVCKAFRRPVQSKFFWTDSMITLAWIRGQPGRFKTFIANRVSTIQELSAVENWRHVGTKENPADLCSRGIYPKEMKGVVLNIWLKGPQWLQNGELPMAASIPEAQEELKKVQVLHAAPSRNPTIEFIEGFSSFNRLVKVTALLGRLGQKRWDITTMVTPEEKQRAFLRLISIVQRQEWFREITALAKARDSSEAKDDVTRVMKRSSISSLNPMLDEMGVLRVGGRLENSNRKFASKHPALLPYGHLAKIYMRGLHVKHLHAGPTLLLATARQEVWPIRGPQLGKEIVRKCVVCSRWRGTTMQQQMGNLPASRLSGHRAFHTVGVDYAGPVLLKTRKGRGGTTIKTWVAVFVCFTTKAVHLELVSELSAEAFIAALRRFIARRGIPQEIKSDNGTNFVGADKELGTLLSEEKSQGRITEAASQDGIKFQFIPPSAPHQGGLWEAAVKSTKHHLKRVLGASMLTFEEFATVLCQIEALLNSRPLCPLTEDPTNLDILTPGHFLIGQPLCAAPDPSLAHIKENRLGRWQYLQRLQQEFWSRWHLEYLSGLQRRYKWKFPQEDIKLDMLVLIKEDHLAPMQWRRGRVVKLHPGTDGHTRVVTLKTAQGEVDRPIVKLIPIVLE